ncbi:ornithine decarboxylase, partial [Acinetobacter baumannii]
IAEAARVFAIVEARGITLDLVNVGGGFPARYRTDVAPITAYGRGVEAALARHFPGRTMTLIMEPGRSMVGDAGVIAA